MKNELTKFLYGGDYNPEQWPAEEMSEDIKVFKEAKINSATINVFSWALLEPEEGKYDFSRLDKIIDELSEANFQIVLGTSTAAMPAWMFKKYPDIARVDYYGQRHVFAKRENFYPNSSNYQRLMRSLVTELAKRYSKNSHIVLWHINNEYSGNYDGNCYCDKCAKEFRSWLKQKYHTLKHLNEAWSMNVWSHTLTDWDQIMAPNKLGDEWGAVEGKETIVPGLSIDYFRFQSESMKKLYIMERNIIKAYHPDALVTTNFHGTPLKTIDYQAWAKEEDLVSFDSYPTYNEPSYKAAFVYDLMRSLKQKPFLLMESTPSQVNWQKFSPLKRPGQMAATEFQAIAHGADSAQFFQLKQAKGGSEKFHSAVIAHSRRTDTRVFCEVKQLGDILAKVGSTIKGSTSSAKVALYFDWNNYWAFEYIDGIIPKQSYVAVMLKYYRVFYERNIAVDVIGADADFSKYDLIVAPVLYMLDLNLADKFKSYIAHGGNLVTTYLSGMVDLSDNVYLGGYPGPLKDLTGMWVEESDAVVPEHQVKVKFKNGKVCNFDLICDLIRLNGAKVLATYDSEFYQGMPAITKNTYQNGHVWYLGGQLDQAGMTNFFDKIIEELKLPILADSINGVEVTKRVTKSGYALFFVLNMTNEVKPLPQKFLTGYHDLLGKHKVVADLKPWAIKIFVKNN
ncbi:beta-galactosidase [Lactobacillus sp. HT06-2]|uniref:beta-galactosidase n=1 Tax=Lactobacillus sp. HT06-2 TaxID=2080222 RepID=UPI000CD97B29|nr:beta-galactosidase [Lactobacillus sp. HT06-2]